MSEIEELKEEIKKWQGKYTYKCRIESYLETQLTKAKELIENIVRVTWGEGWNYSLDVKVKAEDFLKENK